MAQKEYETTEMEQCHNVVWFCILPNVTDPSLFASFRAKKVVELPDYHFVDHRITIKSHDKDYNKVLLHEHAKARYGLQRKAK